MQKDRLLRKRRTQKELLSLRGSRGERLTPSRLIILLQKEKEDATTPHDVKVLDAELASVKSLQLKNRESQHGVLVLEEVTNAFHVKYFLCRQMTSSN